LAERAVRAVRERTLGIETMKTRKKKSIVAATLNFDSVSILSCVLPQFRRTVNSGPEYNAFNAKLRAELPPRPRVNEKPGGDSFRGALDD
jgi:hypothetical protein